MAKERGLKRFYQLRKYELLKRLRASGSTLDRENDARMANVPFLTPTPYTPTPHTPTQPAQPTPRPSSSSSDVKDLLDYLDNNVREIPKRSTTELRRSLKLKKFQKEIDEIYEQMKILEVRETDSALRNFAKVFTIDGK